MKASDVMVACVSENEPHWHHMVENLVITMRNFGGRLAGARFTAYFVDGIDDGPARTLRELGAEVKVVERYDAVHPTTNKLRMFEDFGENPDAEFLIALDCDTVIVGDISDEIKPGAFRAMPPGRSPLSDEQWPQLLDSFGLSPARTPTVTFNSQQAVPAPYLNSGVIFLPAEFAPGLAKSWTKYTDEFIRQKAAGIEEPWTSYFLDQVSLALALREQDIEVDLIGPELNLPTKARLKGRVPESGDLNIRLVHHHHHISRAGGLLLPSDSPAVNRVLDDLNAVIAARGHRKVPTPPTPLKRVRGVLGKVKRAVRP